MIGAEELNRPPSPLSLLRHQMTLRSQIINVYILLYLSRGDSGRAGGRRSAGYYVLYLIGIIIPCRLDVSFDSKRLELSPPCLGICFIINIFIINISALSLR